MHELNQQTKKKNSLKQGERSFGMHVSLMTSPVVDTLPTTSIGITSTTMPIVASTLKETFTVMTTLFIRQQLDLGIWDIMY